MPNISIYITSYNQKEYLVKAINSVLEQTLKPYEIVIIDDCSTDGSQELITNYATNYPNLIKPIFHTINEGVAKTRIDAMNALTGDYATYLDGDDLLLPTKFEKELKALLDHPNTELAFSDHYYINSEGEQIGAWANQVPLPQGDIFPQVFARDFPRRELFRNELVNYYAWRNIGFYDQNLSIYEDDEMRIRLAKHLRAVYYDEPLAHYRVNIGGLSSAKASAHLKCLKYVYRKNEHLLDDLDHRKRKYVQRKVSHYFASACMAVAWQEVLAKPAIPLENRTKALQYYLMALKYYPYHIDFRLLGNLVFTPKIYTIFKKFTLFFTKRSLFVEYNF